VACKNFIRRLLSAGSDSPCWSLGRTNPAAHNQTVRRNIIPRRMSDTITDDQLAGRNFIFHCIFLETARLVGVSLIKRFKCIPRANSRMVSIHSPRQAMKNATTPGGLVICGAKSGHDRDGTRVH